MKKVYLLIVPIFSVLLLVNMAQAVYLHAQAGAGTALNMYRDDYADGWDGDYEAEVTYGMNDDVYSGVNERVFDGVGYSNASLTDAGLELKSRSYAPDTHAKSSALVSDYFTIDTMSGTEELSLDAILSFDLTGTIEVLDGFESDASLGIEMIARQGHSLGALLDVKSVHYDVYWDSDSSQFVGSNDYSWGNLFAVTPMVTGNTYTFDTLLSLDLEGVQTDEPIWMSLKMYTNAMYATADFSNTLKTNPENPFVITSDLAGSTYQVITDYIGVDGASLFGNVDGEIVGDSGGSGNGTIPVPEPATILLLGTGLVGLAGIRRKKTKK